MFISVCSVCNTITFARFYARSKFICAHPVHLKEIRVKVVHKDYRVKVKVKVTGKIIENPYSGNVKLRWEITPVL